MAPRRSQSKTRPTTFAFVLGNPFSATTTLYSAGPIV